MTIKGQDWAGYQSATPDLTGLDFAFTKVTEGLSYINPRWVAQRDHAKKAGLVWGAYHYPHMSNDPEAEADYFLKQVTWKSGDLIVLDWEGYDAANKGVSNARKLAYRDAWLKYVKGKMPGYKVGMYCNTDYWKNLDTTSNCGDFLWIATAGRAAGDPGITYDWTIHQYSTANEVDHDVAKFTNRAAMAAWAKGTTVEEPPVTDTTFSSVWKTDNSIPAGSTETNATNKFWTAQTFLTGTFENTVQVLAQAKSNGTNISTLIAKVDKLTVGGVDLDALASKVADLLAARLKA